MPEPDDPSSKVSSAALGYSWVGRVLAVTLVMAGPGIAGQWLDTRFGTKFLTLTGLGFGFVLGFTSLIVMVNRAFEGMDNSNQKKTPEK